MSNPNYKRRGDMHGGRGGFNKPRRYWDNDEFYDKRDRDSDRDKRRHRRSRSRSYSRSYSRSRSRSDSRSPRRSHRNSSPSAQPRDQYESKNLQNPYSGNPSSYGKSDEPLLWGNPTIGQGSNNLPCDYIPQPVGPPKQTNGQQQHSATYMDQMQLQLQQQMQRHKYQEEHEYKSADLSLGFQSHSSSQSSYLTNNPALLNMERASNKSKDDNSSVSSGKKKKDRKKKKKRRHSSSSSSGSSSDSSDSGHRRRHSKRDRRSDDSSDDSSENEKSKGKPASASGLTPQQTEALSTQKNTYKKKLEILEREIARLQSKEDELLRAQADTRLVDENLKLQAELKGRVKAVNIVLEKIDNVLIGTKKEKDSDKKKDKKEKSSRSRRESAASEKKYESSSHQTPAAAPVKIEKQHQFEYFDDSLHWCRLCNSFPSSITELLKHLHSKEHHGQVEQLGIDEKPWHKRTPLKDIKATPGAPKIPYRGMQFFSPVEGWYCRLCNAWMGDPHCATEHLKTEEHNSNYMNFMEEHPEWENKWMTDRNIAMERSGIKSFGSGSGLESKEDQNAKSFRVQMRNAVKVEDDNDRDRASSSERQEGKFFSQGSSKREMNVDEWMDKPQKMSLDVLDTQKFAAIVKQKHGGRDGPKEMPSKRRSPSSPPSQSPAKYEEDDRRRSATMERRKHERVELQFSRGGDRDRDGRFRDNRRDRRRSRSRSRSRSRERDRYSGSHHKRPRDSRSRSRERDHHRGGSGRNGRDRDPKETSKNQIKRLPMIGKMPLYKRPIYGKDSTKEEEKKNDSSSGNFIAKQDETSNMSITSDTSVSKGEYGFPSQNYSTGEYGPVPPSHIITSSSSSATPVDSDRTTIPSFSSAQTAENNSSSNNVYSGTSSGATTSALSKPKDSSSVKDDDTLKPPGEKEAPGNGLPDDFQQALDIIYSGGNSKPPGAAGAVPGPEATMAAAVPPTAASSNSYGYSGYTSGYSHYGPYGGGGGYDAYGSMAPQGPPPGYDIEDQGPPGIGPPGMMAGPPPNLPDLSVPPPGMGHGATEQKEEPAPGTEDDMDDLRMLGIDVDDAAFVGR